MRPSVSLTTKRSVPKRHIALLCNWISIKRIWQLGRELDRCLLVYRVPSGPPLLPRHRIAVNFEQFSFKVGLCAVVRIRLISVTLRKVQINHGSGELFDSVVKRLMNME